MRKSPFIFLLAALLAVLILAGCGSANNSSGNSNTDNATFQNISASQLADKLKQGGNFQLIDVRTTEEFADGHIKEAFNIPLDQIPGKLGQISKDKEIILICASGSRSAQAADYLVQQGYSKVVNVEGGMASFNGNIVK